MSTVVDKLKNEQSEIFRTLKEAQELCIITKSGKFLIMFKDRMTKEERVLFPEY